MAKVDPYLSMGRRQMAIFRIIAEMPGITQSGITSRLFFLPKRWRSSGVDPAIHAEARRRWVTISDATGRMRERGYLVGTKDGAKLRLRVTEDGVRAFGQMWRS